MSKSRIRQADRHFIAEMLAEHKVTKKFIRSGVNPFPEVHIKNASLISGISQEQLFLALGNRKLNGRHVGECWFIRIVDLWHFVVSRETEKLLYEK